MPTRSQSSLVLRPEGASNFKCFVPINLAKPEVFQEIYVALQALSQSFPKVKDLLERNSRSTHLCVGSCNEKLGNNLNLQRSVGLEYWPLSKLLVLRPRFDSLFSRSYRIPHFLRSEHWDYAVNRTKKNLQLPYCPLVGSLADPDKPTLQAVDRVELLLSISQPNDTT